MTIARTVGALLGTSESVGVAVAAQAAGTGAEVDVLGGTTSAGVMGLYLLCTPAAAASGELDVTLFAVNATGGLKYPQMLKQIRLQAATGQQKLFLGRVPCQRYHSVSVFNNTDQPLANVSVLYELEKTT